ncbi:MAG: hypothetical protein LBS86_08190 [Treponema sp.]|nr:hypothetical protein [Treponema sp.]
MTDDKARSLSRSKGHTVMQVASTSSATVAKAYRHGNFAGNGGVTT